VTLSKWVKKNRIDRGETPGTTTTESAELRAARSRIRELENARRVPKPVNSQLETHAESTAKAARTDRETPFRMTAAAVTGLGR
jgi:transposase-like protein